MENAEIAKKFYEIADMLEIQNVSFKPRAYRKAAQNIESMSKSLKDVKNLENIPGVGKSIAEKIEELLKTGKLKYYDKLKKQLPVDIIALEKVEGIGPKKVSKLYKELKIKNVPDLLKAAKKHKIRKLDGFGEKTEKQIIENISLGEEKRVSIGIALPLAEQIIEKVKDKEVQKIQYVGSLIRGKETVGDIDILAVTKNAKKTIERFSKIDDVRKVLVKGSKKCSVVLKSNMHVDLRVIPKKQYGSGLNYFTGSKYHGIALRKIAIKKGMKLSEYGLFKGKKVIAAENEKNIYKKLGLQYVPPELRENKGEIEAAIKKKLPKLISKVTQDMQMHSNYSDGADSVEDMAKKCKELGYKVISITDHGGNLKIANAMTYKNIIKRNKEIKKAENIGIKIIPGVEANINNKGNLDVKAKELKELDFVIAAVHSGFKKDNTKRILKALDNKHVDCLGHPTGRIIGRRKGYPLNWDKIFEKLKERNIAVEINAQPSRLDINDELIREAVKKKVKIMINTDAHSVEQLEFMRYGILQARRGWVEKKNLKIW